LKRDISGLKIAWSPDLGYARLDPDVRATTEAAVSSFQDLGCDVVEATPDIPDPWDIVDVIWCASQAGTLAHRMDEIGDLLDPGLRAVAERGVEFSGAEVVRAHTRRAEYYQKMRSFMQNYDLLLTPTLPITAFDVGLDHPGEICGKPVTFLGWTA